MLLQLGFCSSAPIFLCYVHFTQPYPQSKVAEVCPSAQRDSTHKNRGMPYSLKELTSVKVELANKMLYSIQRSALPF